MNTAAIPGVPNQSTLPDAWSSGRVCAQSVELQRALQEWALDFPGLVKQHYLASVCLGFTWSAPWLTTAEHMLGMKLELWTGRVDDLVDSELSSADDVHAVVRRMLLIAHTGELPDQPAIAESRQAERCLAEIRAELEHCPLWPALKDHWLDMTERTLLGMETEWHQAQQLSQDNPPSFEDYWANSDSCHFRLLRLGSWISVNEPELLDHIEVLQQASWHGQLASRLTNDLRSYGREANVPTDLNAIKLGLAEQQIREHISEETAAMNALLEPLVAQQLRGAIFLQRVLAFGNGFFSIRDFREPLQDVL